MLSVCHFISGDLWAGAEVVAFHLLKRLKEYPDLDISVIILNEGRLSTEIRRLGVKVHVVDESKRSFLNILMTIRQLLHSRSLDVIHSHRYKENILAFLISRFIPDVKLLGTQHGLPEMNRAKAGLKARFISICNFFLLCRCFHRTVGVSQNIKEYFIEKCGFNEEKIHVIHNGIDIPNIRVKKNNGEPFVIGSSGRLFPVKDYPLMVRIAKVVREESSHIRFELAGDGPDRDQLQTLIQEYDLNGAFVLKGHLEDISSFYQGIDIYLNTSVHEGLPMSILEAMAHGVPIVAPNVGGISEILDDGVEGYLVEKRDAQFFAEKCLALFENNALHHRMSRAAREKVVRAFSDENMAKKYYKLYFELANNQ